MTFIVYNHDDPEYSDNDFDNSITGYIINFNICYIIGSFISNYISSYINWQKPKLFVLDKNWILIYLKLYLIILEYY